MAFFNNGRRNESRCSADVYQHALDLLAVELYRRATLTLGQAAKLAGLPYGDFIDLCGKLWVPVLWELEGGLGSEVDRVDHLLKEAGSRD